LKSIEKQNHVLNM